MIPSVIPPELKGQALKKFIVDNEALIIHAKKSAIKKADGITNSVYFSVNDKGDFVVKALQQVPKVSASATKLALDVCINTTNYFDSHWDVHIPGLWKKSLSESGKAGFYLLEKHQNDFRAVIGDGMKGKATKMSWKDLGFDYTGITEALMFSGTINKERNEYMFDQYAAGYVKQHSVGMQYVKIVTCINDEAYPVQKENWDKYFPMVVNSQECEDMGIFWAVLEAKVNEGSAVLFGSNDLTPTQSVEEIKEASNSTGKEPLSGTHEQPQTFDIMSAIKKAQFFNK